jgi:uncharacterized protein YkwD
MSKMRAGSGSDRVRPVVLAVLLAGILVACVPQSPGPPAGVSAAESPAAGAAIALDVFVRLDADRVASGLRPLRWNAQLADLAREHTDQMASTGVFAHRDLSVTIRLPFFTAYGWLGENILVGPGTTSGDAMERAWMASPGHRANILSPHFDSVGIAVGWGADGRAWATQDFGGPHG